MIDSLKIIWNFMMDFLAAINSAAPVLMTDVELIEQRLVESSESTIYYILHGTLPIIGITEWQGLTMNGLEILTAAIVTLTVGSLALAPVKTILGIV